MCNNGFGENFIFLFWLTPNNGDSTKIKKPAFVIGFNASGVAIHRDPTSILCCKLRAN